MSAISRRTVLALSLAWCVVQPVWASSLAGYVSGDVAVFTGIQIDDADASRPAFGPKPGAPLSGVTVCAAGPNGEWYDAIAHISGAGLTEADLASGAAVTAFLNANMPLASDSHNCYTTYGNVYVLLRREDGSPSWTWTYTTDWVAAAPVSCTATASPETVKWTMGGSDAGVPQSATVNVQCSAAATVQISGGAAESGPISVAPGVNASFSWNGPVQSHAGNAYSRTMVVQPTTNQAVPGSYTTAIPLTVDYQ